MRKIAAGICLWMAVALGVTAQIDHPEAPVLLSVSIEPETGYIVLTWEPSPSDNVDYYRILEWLPDISVGTPIGPPVYDDQTSLSYDLPHFKSVGFIVVGVDDLGGGDTREGSWSTIDSTIYLESTYDSCRSVISLVWNDYNTWRGSIAEYNIYRYMAAGMYELLRTVDEGTNTMELFNILPNQTYDIFIEAVHIDGRRSTSNRRAVETQMAEIPGLINADYATISAGNGIDVSFTVLGTPGSTRYNLLRGNSFDGPFAVIDSFVTSDTRIFYTDEESFTSGVRFYMLEAINDCGLGAVQSNLANNIILSGSMDNMTVSLQWNEYRDWAGDVQQYDVVRTIGRHNPVVDTLYGGMSTFFNDDISNFLNFENPAEGLICYTILATENRNALNIQGESQSNQVCFSINPGVRMPNAFIPNDAEPANQVFEPVFSFLPEHYEMIIYNRLGLKIWEGSEPWDGRVNGEFVPEGVYLYYLRVFNYTSDITELNGRVTVLYR